MGKVAYLSEDGAETKVDKNAGGNYWDGFLVEN